MTLRTENPRAYSSWHHMKRRCLDSNTPAWPYYGGRGITVCDRWMLFEAFLEDMGEPQTGCSLDRINNDGNYEPGNCRWATAVEQAANRSAPHWPNKTGFNEVGTDYLLGYGGKSKGRPLYSTVIRPKEIPGRPEYEGETEWVRGRVVKPPAA